MAQHSRPCRQQATIQKYRFKARSHRCPSTDVQMCRVPIIEQQQWCENQTSMWDIMVYWQGQAMQLHIDTCLSCQLHRESLLHGMAMTAAHPQRCQHQAKCHQR